MTEVTLTKHFGVPLRILACGRPNWTYKTGIFMAEGQVPDWAIPEAVVSHYLELLIIFCGPVHQQ